MSREDRELLAELAQLNTALAPLAIRIICTVDISLPAQRKNRVGLRRSVGD